MATRTPRASRNIASQLTRSVGAIAALALVAILISVLRFVVVLALVQPQDLTLESAQAALASQQVGMLDEETGLRAYLATGETTFLGTYHTGASELASSHSTLASDSSKQHDIAAAVASMETAQLAWQDQWANPALAMHPPRAAGPFLLSGQQLFQRFLSKNATAVSSVNTDQASVSSLGNETLVPVLVIETLLGFALLLLHQRQRRQLRLEITQPVGAIIDGITRMRTGNYEPIPAVGPTELRTIATAVGDTAIALSHAQRLQVELEAALIDSQERTYSFLEGLPVGVIVVNTDHRVIYSNRVTQMLLGQAITPDTDSREVVGQLGLVRAGTDRPYDPGRLPITRALDGETVEVDDVETLNRPRRRLHIWGTPVTDSENHVLFAIGALVDVTREKQMEVALRDRALELEHSNRDLEQFAYIASHDLQEPLRMVSSYVQLLQSHMEGKLDADARLYVGYAVDGVDRMAELIQSLLAFSRAGRPEATERVSLAKVVEVAIRTLSKSTEEVGGSIVVEGELPDVTANRSLLTQLMQNLVSNALKFHGEAAPRIQISATRTAAAQWEVVVSDNGIGIPEEHRSKVFRMFQRLHGRYEYPGSGIGLAICQRIVENLGGRIWVGPGSGSGTAVHFTVPVIEESSDS